MAATDEIPTGASPLRRSEAARARRLRTTWGSWFVHVAVVGVVLALLSTNAPAEPSPASESPEVANPSTSNVTRKVRGEVALYDDTDSVGVFTSALTASIENPVSYWSATGSYLVDVVSAASVDIVSTASARWTEIRHAGTLAATRKLDVIGISASAAVSSEPDYLSLSGGARVSLDVANKMAMPTLGYAYTHDTAGRTGTPFSIYSLELARHTVSGGVEFVVDRSTFLSVNADVLLEAGDQTKPYRFLALFSPETAGRIQPGASLATVNNTRLPGRMMEHDPDRRHRVALSSRLAHRLMGSTFVLSERLYADDWGLKASTTDMRWSFDAGARIEVWGHLRGHVQTGVDFWKLAYAGVVGTDGVVQAPLYRTGDRELSALSTGTFGVGLRWKLTALENASQCSVGLQSDLLLTFFRDALHIRDRGAFLNALDVEAQF